MSRPFDIHMMPPIFGEVKNGEKTDKGFPTKLNYWKVVQRERVGKNWAKLDEVHDILAKTQGPQPKSIPIVLLSDDPEENMPGFRSWFEKGTLMLGAPYPFDEFTDAYFSPSDQEIPESYVIPGDEDAPYAYFVKGTDNKVPPDVVDGEAMTAVSKNGDEFEVELVRLRTKKVGVATKYYEEQGGSLVTEGVTPQSVPFHENSYAWREGRATLQHTLYFHLAKHLPYSDRLFVYRATGIYAQRTLLPSLRMIHNMTGGILAGLELRLEFREEAKKTPMGTQYLPHPAITIGTNIQDFEDRVLEEIERRQKRYELIHGERAKSLEPLLRGGMLKGMQSREALESVVQDSADAEPAEHKEEEDCVPEELRELFNKAGYTKRKEQALMERFAGDVEAIKAEVEQHIKELPVIPQEIGDSNDGLEDFL